MMFTTSLYSTNNNRNSTSLSEEAAISTVSTVITSKIHHEFTPSMTHSSISNDILEHDRLYPSPHKIKKRRNLPGNSDPDAEVIALSPKSLMATNKLFVCEICNKGFQRDQNLQLHRRGHNLPWKLKQRNKKDEIKKRVYVCPEPSCVHHYPSRALGDITEIKKHFCRKHGEKKWKCDKCDKIYAVQSDWKAHSKTCGTREYRCDCGTLFSRKDSFITHKAFCDALAEETAISTAAAMSITNNYHPPSIYNTTHTPFKFQQDYKNSPSTLFPFNPTLNNTYWLPTQSHDTTRTQHETIHLHQHLLTTISSPEDTMVMMISRPPPRHLPSATAFPQNATTAGALGDHMGSTVSSWDMETTNTVTKPEYHQHMSLTSRDIPTWQKTNRLTRDFLGLTSYQEDDHDVDALGLASEAWSNC